MKLKVRYDNAYQTLELDAEATEQLWITLSLEGEGLSQEEREKLIQDEWEERLNKPDYNSWHKFDRHRGFSKAQPGKDEDDEDTDTSEPLMKEVADDRIFRRDELARIESEEYEEVCQRIRAVLEKKPDWAEAFIAVCLEGEEETAYARRIGDTQSNVAHKLARAKKKIAAKFWKPS